MKNSGCHGNQSKKPLKIFYSQTTDLIAFLFYRNVPYIEVYRIPLKKMISEKKKNMAFKGDSFSFYYGIG